MKRMTIVRVAGNEEGTFGVLMDEGQPFCLTLERKWLNNMKEVSCIPDGEYLCRRIQSPRHGNTFEVTKVPERSEILFHKGNLMDDSHGCVVVGEQFEPLEGKNGVVASGKAFEEFLQRTKGLDEFNLSIRSVDRERSLPCS